MRYSVRAILILAAAVAIPACGGGGAGDSSSDKSQPVAGGVPDLAFGLTGAVARNASPYSDLANTVLSDGTFVYVAGTSTLEPDNSAGQIEKRYLAGGMFDFNFGANGVLTANASAGLDPYRSMAMDADHLYVVGSDHALAPDDGRWRIEKRTKATGALVQDFGIKGVVNFNFAPVSDSDYACHAGVQGSWLYVVGRRDALKWRVLRLDLVTGLQDVVWGGDVVDDGYFPAAFAIDETRLYLGLTYGPDPVDKYWTGCWFSLVDNTFGGLPIFNPTPGTDLLNAIAVKDGFAYLAGGGVTPGTAVWQVRKVHLGTMTLDPAFGAGGVLTIDPSPSFDWVTRLAIDGAYLFVQGVDGGGIGGRSRIEKRLLTTGAAAPSFAALSDPSPLSDAAHGLFLIDGWILSAGVDMAVSDGQWRLEKRSQATGALDAAFGSPGVVVRDADPTRPDTARIVLVQDGFLYVAGSDRIPGPNDSRWRIEKRSAATGVPDGTFGEFGHLFIDPSDGIDEPTAMVIDGNWLYIGGAEYPDGTSKWRIEKRSIVDGSPDPGFGNGGWVSWKFGPAGDRLNALLIAGGFLWAAGMDSSLGNDDFQWRIARLDPATGLPVAGFGPKGHVTINPGPGGDTARFLGYHNGSLFVGGIDAVGGDWRWRVEKLNPATGAPVGGFTPILSNPSSMQDYFEGMAVADGAIYMAGLKWEANGSSTWLLEKHAATNGKLVGSFGTGGQVLLNLGEQFVMHPTAIVVSGGFLYVGGAQAAQYDMGWRLEKRKATSGALVGSFGTDGAAFSNHIFLDTSAIYGLAVDASDVYAVGVWQGEARIEKRNR